MRFQKREKPTKEQIDSLKTHHNPFVDETFVIKTVKKTNANEYKSDDDGYWLPKEYRQETASAVKIYVSAEYRKSIAMLSDSSCALLHWIMQELRPGIDYVVLNEQRFRKEHRFKTDKPFKTGIIELSRYQFIAITPLLNVYFINPKFMFSGSRIKKYPNHIREE